MDAVYKLLSEAWSRQQILLYAATEWGVSQRMTDEYIARARELLLADAEMQRPAWLAEALGRLRNYEQQAARRGQMQVAINSVQTQAKLIGFEV